MMRYFLFYVEGPNREMWQPAADEKEARKLVWGRLSDEQKDATVQFECLEEVSKAEYYALAQAARA